MSNPKASPIPVASIIETFLLAFRISIQKNKPTYATKKITIGVKTIVVILKSENARKDPKKKKTERSVRAVFFDSYEVLFDSQLLLAKSLTSTT